MSKYIELLHRIAEGDNRGDFFISNELLKEIEAILAQPEQTEQEPVAWMYDWTNEIGELIKGVYVGSHKASHLYELENLQPLYLAPPKREPLSNETIAKLWGESYSGTTQMVRNFARAIEQQHGIGGE